MSVKKSNGKEIFPTGNGEMGIPRLNFPREVGQWEILFFVGREMGNEWEMGNGKWEIGNKQN